MRSFGNKNLFKRSPETIPLRNFFSPSLSANFSKRIYVRKHNLPTRISYIVHCTLNNIHILPSLIPLLSHPLSFPFSVSVSLSLSQTHRHTFSLVLCTSAINRPILHWPGKQPRCCAVCQTILALC